MMQPLSPSYFNGLHVAIIMDGSGRWAQVRGLPRTEGHRAGASAVRRIIQVAPDCGIGTLTLHAFSSDNWRRPPTEVASLLKIFTGFLRSEPPVWRSAGIRLNVFGRRDRLPQDLLDAIAAAETDTMAGSRLHLRLAIDYSSREAILRAAQHTGRPPNLDGFPERLAAAMGERSPARDLDLMIRTGGEQRLSDFMLWECAYAELYFSRRLWPDFTAEELRAAVEEFHRRDRRFGRIPESIAV